MKHNFRSEIESNIHQIDNMRNKYDSTLQVLENTADTGLSCLKSYINRIKIVDMISNQNCHGAKGKGQLSPWMNNWQVLEPKRIV